jgi:hypothetical protein
METTYNVIILFKAEPTAEIIKKSNYSESKIGAYELLFYSTLYKANQTADSVKI